jgi:hypothetical protein
VEYNVEATMHDLYNYIVEHRFLFENWKAVDNGYLIETSFMDYANWPDRIRLLVTCVSQDDEWYRWSDTGYIQSHCHGGDYRRLPNPWFLRATQLYEDEDGAIFGYGNEGMTDLLTLMLSYNTLEN